MFLTALNMVHGVITAVSYQCGKTKKIPGMPVLVVSRVAYLHVSCYTIKRKPICFGL